MSASLSDIRAGMAANLATLDGIQVSPYMLASPTPPALHIIPASIEYDQAMARGVDLLVFTVQVFVALGLDQAAQIKLDEYLAPTGIKAALESDRTLGGVVADVRVSGLSSYDVVALPDRGQMLAASFRVEVYS